MGMLGLNVKVFPMPLSKQPALLIDVIKRPSIFVQECCICFVFSPLGFLFIYLFFVPQTTTETFKEYHCLQAKTSYYCFFSIFKDFMVNFNIPQIYKGNNSKFKN